MTVIDERPDMAADDPPGFYKRLHARLHAHPVTGLVTKVVITVIGTLVVLVGIVLSGPGVPGPGLVVIVFGLAILSTEWEWADRLLKRARAWLHRQREKARQMDPVVRRRRIVLGLVAVIVVTGAVLSYLWFYDWPALAVTSWDRVQSIHDVVPELPGM